MGSNKRCGLQVRSAEIESDLHAHLSHLRSDRQVRSGKSEVPNFFGLTSAGLQNRVCHAGRLGRGLHIVRAEDMGALEDERGLGREGSE